MDEASSPVGGDGEAVSVITPDANLPAELSPSEAAKALADIRWKRNNPQAPAEPAVETQQELPDEGNAAPQDEATGEEPKAVEPEDQLPPLDPPRSWTKAEQERFRTLPRETQEYLHQRETDRDREVRRNQNETAEKLKAISAREQEIDKVRQEYEAKLPALVQALQDVQAGQFSDIKSMDDVTRLANEDPFRYLQWQAHQQKLLTINHESEKAKERELKERMSNWAQYVQLENAKAAEANPELADPEKAKKLQGDALELLKDKGFTAQELGGFANGEKVSLMDHRIQSLILDGVKYRQALKAPSKAVPPTVPPVQKPGVAKPAGSAAAERIQALQQTFERNPTLENAHALRIAQSQTGRRA
jgi:hypothetical protein